MTRFRFSMLSLMLTVFIVAVGFAALRSAAPLWAGVATTVTLGALVFGIVGILFGQARLRVFWGGFVVCGWAYLVFVFAPWFNHQAGGYLVTTFLLEYLHPKLAKSIAPKYDPPGTGNTKIWPRPDNKFWVDGQVVPKNQLAGRILQVSAKRNQTVAFVYTDTGTVPQSVSQAVTLAIKQGSVINTVVNQFLPIDPNRHSFERVGHSLFTLLIALAGGVLAVWCFGERGQPDHTDKVQNGDA